MLPWILPATPKARIYLLSTSEKTESQKVDRESRSRSQITTWETDLLQTWICLTPQWVVFLLQQAQSTEYYLEIIIIVTGIGTAISGCYSKKYKHIYGFKEGIKNVYQINPNQWLGFGVRKMVLIDKYVVYLYLIRYKVPWKNEPCFTATGIFLLNEILDAY